MKGVPEHLTSELEERRVVRVSAVVSRLDMLF